MWTAHEKCGIFNMKRTFVETPIFQKRWAAAGYGEEELRDLQEQLLENPSAGIGIQSGLRKLRYSFGNGGKRSGARVIYYDLLEDETIYLMYCFRKKDDDNLTDEQAKQLVKAVKRFKRGE